MNIGERIAILQEELKSEDKKQEVLYVEFQRLCDLCPDDLDKTISSDERQELITLNKARKRGESEALARRLESLTWKSAEETDSHLGALRSDLRRTNRIIERITEILKKAMR